MAAAPMNPSESDANTPTGCQPGVLCPWAQPLSERAAIKRGMLSGSPSGKRRMASTRAAGGTSLTGIASASAGGFAPGLARRLGRGVGGVCAQATVSPPKTRILLTELRGGMLLGHVARQTVPDVRQEAPPGDANAAADEADPFSRESGHAGSRVTLGWGGSVFVGKPTRGWIVGALVAANEDGWVELEGAPCGAAGGSRRAVVDGGQSGRCTKTE